MGHQNYSKFSQNLNNNQSVIIKTEVKEPELVVTEPEVKEPETTIMVCFVTGCKRLNVRKEPSKDAKILCVINEDEELTVDMMQNDAGDFYKVRTSKGVDGYCMKQYISVK